MKNIIRVGSVNKRAYVAPFLVIVLIHFIINYISVQRRIDDYRGHLRMDSLNFARSYAISLGKSAEATDIVNELMENRLLVAAKSTALMDSQIDDDLLAKAADNFRVDIIHYYDSQGTILHSSDGSYIGWSAYEGHPVREFIESGLEFFTEDIRMDTGSPEWYKYAHYRRPDGGSIQVGIYADEIHEFLTGFEIQRLLENIAGTDLVDRLFFIDDNLEVIGSFDKSTNIEILNDMDMVEAIEMNIEYSSVMSVEGRDYYISLIPIYVNQESFGTLGVAKSTEETGVVIRDSIAMGLYNLGSVILIMGVLIYHLRGKNKELEIRANFDGLTGLPNLDHLKDHVRESSKNNSSKAILLVNTSNFRYINLTYGYHYGDSILKSIAETFRRIAEENHFISRFTADRFVIYVEDYKNTDELVHLAERITISLEKPIVLNSTKQYVDTQIAIVENTENLDNLDDLLREVSIALDHIDKDQDVNYIFFSQDMEEKLGREDTIEKEIRNFIDDPNSDAIYLEYQPKLDLVTGEIVALEALARMNSKTLGKVSPMEFIGIAEKRLLIAPLGSRIMDMALGFIRILEGEGFDRIRVAVNISGVQLLRDDFLKMVTESLEKHGVDPSNLELEITESVLLENYSLVSNKLGALRERGIEISLDDFGTGYSSLARLGELNIDIIKIDRYFINKIDGSKDDNHLTHDIISMAHKTGLKTVAEGVETMDQLEYLRRNNCDYIQGYLLSRPMGTREVLEFLIGGKDRTL